MTGVLFDLDGVFYIGDEPVEGGVDTLDWCKKHKIPYGFVTNTSSRPRSALVEKLDSLGIEANHEQIFTPPVAAVQWIRENVSGKTRLFVAAETREDFSSLDLCEPNDQEVPGAVVIGDLGTDWDFETFNAAFQALMTDPQPALVALGTTRYWKTDKGLQLDVGPFVRGLEYAADLQATITGKPAKTFFEQAVGQLNCEAGDAVMIGDDVKSDVLAAQSSGLQGILVRTGKYQPQDEQGENPPDHVIDSIADFPDWWKVNATD